MSAGGANHLYWSSATEADAAPRRSQPGENLKPGHETAKRPLFALPLIYLAPTDSLES
jgi:hypothetical protein